MDFGLGVELGDSVLRSREKVSTLMTPKVTNSSNESFGTVVNYLNFNLT